MTDGSIDQSGEGPAVECGSQPIATQCRMARGSTAFVTKIQSVRAASIPVPGGSSSARPAGRSHRGHGAHYIEDSAEHGAPATGVCEEQRPDHRSDCDTCVERISEYSKKAWLSRPQDAVRFKSMSSMRLIVCMSRNLPRFTVFWCPAGSTPSAGV
jgi:hypothetical protein